jgi:hypothetical protein
MRWLSVLALAACGGSSAKPIAGTSAPAPQSTLDRMVALLPDGAQIVVELDLARLRGNATVGEVATKALAGGAPLPAVVPGIAAGSAAGSPLAHADALVFAAYGVGTAQAITVALVATTAELPDATRVTPDIVALGPTEWTGQLATRAAIGDGKLVVPSELRALREHAVPKGATGAVVRATARLPFDARVALARMTGLDSAPARIAVWGDVADDLVLVIDADADDPGEKKRGTAVKRMAATLRGALAGLGDVPVVKALGFASSLGEARQIVQGTWVRTIVEVGPRHLGRVVERAREMLAAP